MSNQNSRAGTAAVLSFVFSGLGQIYNGQIKKGLVLVLLTLIGTILILVSAIVLGVLIYRSMFPIIWVISAISGMCLGGVIVCWVGIYSIGDAYKGNSA